MTKDTGHSRYGQKNADKHKLWSVARKREGTKETLPRRPPWTNKTPDSNV
jgi:hypothetical protein